MSLRSKLILMFAMLIIMAVSALTAYSSFYQRQTYIRNEMMTQKQVLSLIHNNVTVQLYAFTNEQLQGVLSIRNMLHEKGQTLSHRIAQMQASIEANYNVKFDQFPASNESKNAWTKEQLEAQRMFINFLSFEKASYNQVGSDIVATYDLDVILAPINQSIAQGVSVTNRALLPTMLTKTNQYSAGYYLSIFNREFSTVANLADNIAASKSYLDKHHSTGDIAPPKSQDNYFILDNHTGKLKKPVEEQDLNNKEEQEPLGSNELNSDVIISLGKTNAFRADKFNNQGQGARIAIEDDLAHTSNEDNNKVVVLGSGQEEQMLVPQMKSSMRSNDKNTLFDKNKQNYLSYLFKTHMDSPYTYAIVQSVDKMIEQYVDVEGKVLARIQEHMDDLRNYLKGEALIIDNAGVVLSSSNKEPLFTNAPDNLYQYLVKQRKTQIDNKALYGDLTYEQIVHEQSFTFDLNDKTYLANTIYFRPLGWFIINVVDIDTIVGPALSSALVLVIMGSIIMVISLLLAAIFSNSIARRLMVLVTKAKVMSATNLSDYDAVKKITDSIKVTGKDEVADLSKAFKLMGKSISRNINLLMTANSQKNRMEGELNAAKDIQMGMLPTNSELPQSDNLANAALLYPAKEVGGDLYDIYRLDDHHIIYCVGDVSDKGVPAALFMSTTVTLARACLCMGMSPQDTMTLINGRLSERNPNMMFVTMYIAILDERTGQVVACNAGHCLPVIIRRELISDDSSYDKDNIISFDSSEDTTNLLEPEDIKLKVVKVEEIEEISGPAVGPLSAIAYTQYSFELGHYDLMLLYTDGVSEAQNDQGGFFGVERILQLSNKAANVTPQGLIKALNDEVAAFRGNYYQSDDITMVVCSRLGNKL